MCGYGDRCVALVCDCGWILFAACGGWSIMGDVVLVCGCGVWCFVFGRVFVDVRLVFLYCDI